MILVSNNNNNSNQDCSSNNGIDNTSNNGQLEQPEWPSPTQPSERGPASLAQSLSTASPPNQESFPTHPLTYPCFYHFIYLSS